MIISNSILCLYVLHSVPSVSPPSRQSARLSVNSFSGSRSASYTPASTSGSETSTRRKSLLQRFKDLFKRNKSKSSTGYTPQGATPASTSQSGKSLSAESQSSENHYYMNSSIYVQSTNTVMHITSHKLAKIMKPDKV